MVFKVQQENQDLLVLCCTLRLVLSQHHISFTNPSNQQLVALLNSGKGPITNLVPLPLPVGNPGDAGPPGPEGPVGSQVHLTIF